MVPYELQVERELTEDLDAMSFEIIDAHYRHESGSAWAERRVRIAELRERVWRLQEAHLGNSGGAISVRRRR